MSGLAVKKEMRGPVNMVAALSHGLPTILNFTKSFVEVVVWKTQISQNKRKVYPNPRVLNRSCTYLLVNSAFVLCRSISCKIAVFRHWYLHLFG